MMKDALAIAAQVVDIQNDRQHKGSIKVTLHVPAELGPQLTEALGWPTYTAPVPVALARLDLESVRAKPEPKQRNSLAVTAGMLCKDKDFQEHILQFGYEEPTEENAAEYIRRRCGVDSRSEIKYGTQAAEYFNWMHQEYLKWLSEHQL